MILFALLAALASLLPGDAPATVRSAIVSDRLIMRVPIRPRSDEAELGWREGRSQRCIPAARISGAVLAGQGSIDLLFRQARRVRADLDRDCPTLDFYGGFYVEPREGRICAGRDAIRSRMGATCQIQRFRWLLPVR